MDGAPVLIVGAGPVGRTLALELARFEVPTIVLDAKPGPAREGSRAIVLARHALAAFVRVGCGGPMLERAVVLARARTYHRTTELFCADLPAEPGGLPRFVNLQQTHTEAALRDAVARAPSIELRWGSAVVGQRQDAAGVTVELERGRELRGSHVVGCDGGRSRVRELLGVGFPGRSHRDRFLIADVRGALPLPRDERRFFFDPPENPGRTMLVHPQPDGEWRLDWQVPGDTDAEEERRSRRLDERIRRLAGHRDYEVVWVTAYRFHQRVAERWRVGRAFLAGDAAHLFSPFGARGMNSGVEDAGSLGWRLGLVRAGFASDAVLDGYAGERRPAALENLRVTAATMRFMAPPTPLHRLARHAILRGSVRSAALRRRVDSGKLAEPALPLVPPGSRVVPLAHGFGTVRVGGANVLVRPDGYAWGPVEGDPAETLERVLKPRDGPADR